MSYCSCTAVILPAACGEARGGVVVAEGISRWKAETHKANRSWAAHRGKMPCPETRSSMGFGAAPHVFPKLGEFSHKMELWPCDFQRRVFDTWNETQAVPAGWSTSALTHFIPRRKGEEPTSSPANPPWSVGCVSRAHDSFTFTTP